MEEDKEKEAREEKLERFTAQLNDKSKLVSV